MPKTEEKAQISADMTISTILELHPKGAEIMQQFGLHCFGCSINVLETLEQGILGHGMPQSTLNELLDALNDDFENLSDSFSPIYVEMIENFYDLDKKLDLLYNRLHDIRETNDRVAE